MKIFISWSGELSKLVAIELRSWLKKVIQSADPFMSSKDTSPGSRLYSEIYKELEGTQFGISCITAENQENTWINFEAGALAKNTEGRVCPLLIDDIDATVLKAPLNQFKYIYFKKEDMLELIKDINENLDDKIDRKLEPETLNETFNIWWDDLNTKITKIKEDCASKAIKKMPKPNTDKILEEVLLLCRGMNQSIQNLSTPQLATISGFFPGEQAVGITTRGATVYGASLSPSSRTKISETKRERIPAYSPNVADRMVKSDKEKE